MKQRLIWFNLQKDGTRNELSNIKETFAEIFCTNIWAFSSHAGLSSSYDGWEKCEDKVLYVSDLNQNVETRSHSKLKFNNSKIYQGAGKLVEDEYM